MQIRVLGPFEVSLREDMIITPSAPKLCRVLMLLALQPGRVVRTSQLMAELWDDRPPTSASTTLQTYIYQLRKLLDRAAKQDPDADHDPVTLVTTPVGYLLQLPRPLLDAARFEELVAAGRAQLDEGHLVEGASVLADALALWRGPALAAVEVGPVLQAEVARLEELRKVAVEQRIAADLQLGRHRQLVGELFALVAEQPIHEGLQAQLMVALYRSGRRSEALTAYRSAHAVLAAELGLEPCAELRQLHHQMLASDPSLDYTGEETAVAAAAAEPPSLLPAEVKLVGREKVLAELTVALGAGAQPRPPVVAVSGAPGTGKSAVCVHAARAVRADYPDGQFWAELTTSHGAPVEPVDVLADFLRAVGCDDARIPADLQGRARMFRSWTADRRVLVVLDDVSWADQMLPLLPSGARCATLVSCRRRMSHPLITESVSLPRLRRAAARALLIGSVGAERLHAEPDAVDRLLEISEGLPAVLHAIAGQLQIRPHWSVTRLLDRYADVSPLATGSAVAQPDYAEVVRRTYGLLQPPVQSAFCRLATATERPISVGEAARVLEVQQTAAEAMLEDLVAVHLSDVYGSVPPRGEVRYTFRPFYRAAAVVLDGGREELRQAVRA